MSTTTLVWLQALTLAGVAIIAAMVRGYLTTYLGEKAKNLATKEDVATITQKVESVKAGYAETLETIRASLGSRGHIHRFRYESEFAILQELMEKLVELRDATLSLRPEVGYVNPDESEEDQKKRLIKRYVEASRVLYVFSETRQPFFPEEILAALRQLDQIAWKEVVQYRRRSPTPGDPSFDSAYWDRAAENGAAIAALTDSLIQSIRARVRRWEAFDPGP